MKETRVVEIRAADPTGTEGLVIEGRPILYDQPTTIHDPAGPYTEIIRSGALEGADLSDARLLYNHDMNRMPLARTPKTMQFIQDPAGLKMVANLPNTEEARAIGWMKWRAKALTWCAASKAQRPFPCPCSS